MLKVGVTLVISSMILWLISNLTFVMNDFNLIIDLVCIVINVLGCVLVFIVFFEDISKEKKGKKKYDFSEY